MSRIKVIDYEESTGRLRAIYDDLIKNRGKLADVHTIQSLHPESIVAHMNLYIEIMFNHSELSRAEREMIAVVVSVNNGCNYCRTHHSEALNKYWKDNSKIQLLLTNIEAKGLSEKENALCRFAKHLTLYPHLHEKTDFTKELSEVGIAEQGILDAVLVVAYFNFVNRLVLSLGVELETDKGAGYNY
ncbi:MAG: peroxidase [Porphyromonadaceae bacterium CG2_30_38_12]|nr:MAG: peroxidase [Porphyromonadaceae bacterium CG2_30_38_12]